MSKIHTILRVSLRKLLKLCKIINKASLKDQKKDTELGDGTIFLDGKTQDTKDGIFSN